MTEINGTETHLPPASPEAALSAFYKGFNGRDLAAVEANWLATDAAAMSNPVGGVMRGWDQIRGVYQRIFGGPATVWVAFHDFTIHQTDGMFCAVGRERGTFTRDGATVHLKIRTSRVFVMTPDGWRQLHHHGSIDDPELLARYQMAVRG
ncbi:MAG: nuclear transport factor 2 family protein [Nitrospirae bacterium]|nr:nuclear transport factor 2 family protein [Nitrospirota bacterium]